ncbi:hypothetical protein ACHHYP_13634 [Achlya hypogyna]|uniref:PX domain-containing protein n=1 Tax=Achlya hypogyna TaxID=1202772 RepID=A0A1V9ZFH3_ACHHY|nr:hypothetical protein ACHHYP_13634 [Achlya hypogyna]
MLRALFSMCVPAPDVPLNKDMGGRETARVATLPSRYCVRAITDVAITSSSIIEKQGSDVHTVYAVAVSRQGEHWTVQRRYRQFLELHTKLVKIYGISTSFPHRIYYKNRGSEVVQQREAALHAYLKELMTNDEIKASAEFRTFVGAEIERDGKYTQFSYAYRSGRKLLCT